CTDAARARRRSYRRRAAPYRPHERGRQPPARWLLSVPAASPCVLRAMLPARAYRAALWRPQTCARAAAAPRAWSGPGGWWLPIHPARRITPRRWRRGYEQTREWPDGGQSFFSLREQRQKGGLNLTCPSRA